MATPIQTLRATGLESLPLGSPAPSGFAFDPADVIGYYTTLGYTCGDPVPSSQADGYVVTSCRLVDAEGRTRTAGFVIDADGRLGDGYASVRGADGEAYLEPDAALDPLAAFLGAMLGGERGAEAAIWMKEHLGEAYAARTLGTITVATYTAPGDDPSELFVEVADPAYVAASPAPT